jgi:predicted phage tail protein
MDLTWHLSTGASSYRVEVGISRGGTFTSFTTGVTSSFTISDLAPGTYYLRVRGVNGSLTSAPSNEVVISGTAPATAPRNLSAVVIGGTVVQLTWALPSDATDLSGYVIEAGTGPGRADLGSIPVDGLEFTSPSIPNGTYFLRVRARNTTGGGSPSIEVGVQIGNSTPCTTPPGTPQLVVGAVGTLVQLSWSAGTGEAPSGYVLDVGSTPGRRDIATMQFGTETLSFSAAAANGTYALRMSAVNACGSSQGRDETLAVGGPAPTLPTAPVGLNRYVTGREVRLTWSPPMSGSDATRYLIEATDTQGNPIVTLDTANLSTAFVHGDVPPGTYVVRVRAANAAGAGTPSNAVTVVVTP